MSLSHCNDRTHDLLNRWQNLHSRRFSIGAPPCLIASCVLVVMFSGMTASYAQSKKIDSTTVSTDLIPLTELSGAQRYKQELGGLYGAGANEPPERHVADALRESAQIVPRDAQGSPHADGKIVVVAFSMSNAEQEFGAFEKLAHADLDLSPSVVVVNTAQGGRAMSSWATARYRTFDIAEQRLARAGVTASQVQVAWVKIPIELIDYRPIGSKDISSVAENIKTVRANTRVVLQQAKRRFPNLRIAYLGSRIYGGYCNTDLNPEPFAYESAFAARSMILDQIQGDAELNFDATKGTVKSPLLIWGPYLWANGLRPRADGLTWERSDFGRDGVHPSVAGEQKVARLLLDFFKSDRTSRDWFTRKKAEFDVKSHPDAVPNIHPPGEVDNPALVPFIISDSRVLPGIVVDESQATLVGKWQYSTHTPPHVGIGYLHDQKEDKGAKSVTYVPNLPHDGRYEVRVSHCYNVRRATNTPITIHHADGEQTVRIDQQQTPAYQRLFRLLGTFRFRAGHESWVRISTNGTEGKYVIADAVQFLPIIDRPHRQAHSHNDYQHPLPLQNALDHGFCSVEADIYLVGQELLVGHALSDTRPERTLERLYLEPLKRRVRDNGGRVFKTGEQFTLLVDIKSDGPATYAALRPILNKYADILTTSRDGKLQQQAISVVISGNRPQAEIAADDQRLVAIDGRLSDLDQQRPTDLVPLISDRWGAHFKWLGHGVFDPIERELLKKLVASAHLQGKRIRFWATPDSPEMWRELLLAGVDLINTDDLAGLSVFLGTVPK